MFIPWTVRPYLEDVFFPRCLTLIISPLDCHFHIYQWHTVSAKQNWHSRVLNEKLRFSQIMQNFLALYGIRMFTTAFIRPNYLSLFWARWIQSTLPHTAPTTSFLILYSYINLALPGGLFPLDFTIKILKAFMFFTFVMHSLSNSFS